MRTEDCYILGNIRKLHGLDGVVNAFLDVDDASAYADLDMVLIEVKSELVPYFIEHIQIRDQRTAIIRFEGVDRQEATRLVKRRLYLPLSRLPRLEGTKFYYHEVRGFMLVDQSFGEIGPIAEVLSYPNQDIFCAMHGEREVLVPVSDAVIRTVDRKNRRIIVDCPEGLIDIYL